jgi:transposase
MMEQFMAVRNRGFTRSGLSVMHPDAAGIDVGSASHFVAVPPDRDDRPVREFASFTVDLNALADWLQRCEVKIVAMESTGVYWIALYELLQRRGFEVLLVNARHVKNVSGRKSDVLDCQWLQQLMSFGLLRGAFRPDDAVCELRSIVRQREVVLRNQSRCVQHMQKALAQMNIQLANVISDVVGVTGQKILRAIAAGERDPQALAEHRDRRIKAKKADIAKSLQGNWRAEHLFALKQALSAFDFCAQQMAECDTEMQRILTALEVHNKDLPKAKKRSTNRNAPKFDLREQLYKFCGVDLTQIDGIDVSTALVVLSEIGADMSRFATVKHFTSWLGLCPGTKISGGKILGAASKRSANRAAQALKIAAASLRSSQSALGAYYRRMCARMDKPKAVTAAAHKLARLIYLLITRGQEYVDQGQQHYEQCHRQRLVRHLHKRAKDLGMTLVEIPQPVQATPTKSMTYGEVS